MGRKQTTPIDDHMHFRNCSLPLKEKPRKIDALSIQVHVLTNLAYFEFSSKSWKKIAETRSSHKFYNQIIQAIYKDLPKFNMTAAITEYTRTMILH